MTQQTFGGPQGAPDYDPLAAPPKAPAMSFKDAPIGTSKLLYVCDFARQVQSRDYDTNELAFWPPNADGTPGKPKMSAVLNGLDGPNGTPISLWATIPSAMLSALRAAQEKLGRRIQPGDALRITFTGEVPNENPRKNPIKQYTVEIAPQAFVPPTTMPDPVAPPQQQAPQQQGFAQQAPQQQGFAQQAPQQQGFAQQAPQQQGFAQQAPQQQGFAQQAPQQQGGAPFGQQPQAAPQQDAAFGGPQGFAQQQAPQQQGGAPFGQPAQQAPQQQGQDPWASTQGQPAYQDEPPF